MQNQTVINNLKFKARASCSPYFSFGKLRHSKAEDKEFLGCFWCVTSGQYWLRQTKGWYCSCLPGTGKMYLKWLASNKIYILNIFSNIYSNTNPKPCLQSYTQCLELFLFQWECCINLIGLLQCRLSGSFTIQFIHLSFQIKDFLSSIYFYHALVECMPEILLIHTALIGDN